MPIPSGLMNERERRICQAVRAVRLELGFPQVKFANALSIGRDKLASIELERTPLRYAIARVLCERLDVCLLWLGEGIPPKFGKVEIPLEIEAMVRPRELFSRAYDEHLRHPVRRAIEQAFEAALCFSMFQGGPKEAADHYVGLLKTVWFEKLDIKDQEALFRWLMGAAAQFRQAKGVVHPMRVPWSVGQGSETNELTDAASSVTSGPVKVHLPNLLEQLRKATAEPGMKTALAKFLRAPLASVSRWLSGEREPGGETVLQMQAWLKRPTK